MNRAFLWWLPLLAAVFIAMPKAHASTYPNARAAAGRDVIARWNASYAGGSTVVGEGGTVAGGLVSRAPVAGAAGAAKVGADGPLKVGEKTVPVGFTGEISKDAIINGAAGCLTGGFVGCVLGTLTPLAIGYLASSGIRPSPVDGSPQQIDSSVCTTAPCYEFGSTSYGWFWTIERACQAYSSWLSASQADYNYTYVGVVGGASLSCIFEEQRKTGGTKTQVTDYRAIKRGRDPGSPTWYPATPQEVRDALYRNDPPVGIVDELAKYGNINWPMGNAKLSGPSSVSGPKEVTQHSDGSTTEKTSKTDYSYSGQKVTEGPTTTTTVKKDPAGNVTSSETTTTTPSTQEGAPDAEGEPTDSPLPPVPNLYTRKYPDGMVGIWNEKKAALMSSPLMQLKDQLLPTIQSSGSCPTMLVNLDFATWANYGTRDVAPPCWVWDFGKVVVILSAMFLARALIFGG